MRDVAPVSRAGELRDDALHRAARRELHHDERYQHDPEDRGDHEQNAANDVGGHFDARCFAISGGSWRRPV